MIKKKDKDFRNKEIPFIIVNCRNNWIWIGVSNSNKSILNETKGYLRLLNKINEQIFDLFQNYST